MDEPLHYHMNPTRDLFDTNTFIMTVLLEDNEIVLRIKYGF